MRLSIRSLAVIALIAAAPLAGAQVYKWTDDKGVVNYSNTPPADAKGKKGVSVVEDSVSVYTADPAVLQATQNARERRHLPPAPEPPRPAVTTAPAPAPPAPSITTTTADPCLNADPAFDCSGYSGFPVFGGRRRPPRLNQPELPAGSIAGNVNAGGGFTPGLSTQAPLGAPAPRVERPRIQPAPGREPERR